jgi:hypothetical protein
MDSKLVMIPGLNSMLATFTLKLPMNKNAFKTLKKPVFYNLNDSKGYVAVELTSEANKHFKPEPTCSRTQVDFHSRRIDYIFPGIEFADCSDCSPTALLLFSEFLLTVL